ncbi:amylo-alpha-1,6-glucosidase [Salinirubrum litoreum]|uniref:Glycogen debranching N-terminal domain-containing protein n=1 Tax=Salinirubrum litoreum TaxID=1126234 RepID=A0ABD5RGQ2_9EURY|nr:glycogen debranching N-terminal domain-containing protein [Salinirubrum litoreum]
MPPRTLVDGYTYLVLPDGESTRFTRDDVGGLYHRDTRYLSALQWTVDGQPLRTLQSTLRTPAVQRELLAPATPTVNDISAGSVPKHSGLVARRATAVAEGQGLVQRLTVSNHTPESTEHEVRVTFDVDFADLFEVRGFDSTIERAITRAHEDGVVTGTYEFAHDGETSRYTTRLTTESDEVEASVDAFAWSPTVPPQGTRTVELAVGLDGRTPSTSPDELSSDTAGPIDVEGVPTSEARHGPVVEQAAADLTALTTETPVGPVPLAGTPWFVTPFGRDALLTAYQTLPVAPTLAVGTLRYLARHRATTTDPVTEAEPGKILHEQRNGELAARGLIPHTPYYGTVDATPLWVVLLAETVAWLDSPALATDLRAPLRDALEWIYRATERGPDDPFVYYDSSDHGLTHKAWKDTADSIRAADGTPAGRPLAVAEVQSYASRALADGAELLERIDTDTAPPRPLDEYAARASTLRTRFDEEFWLPDAQFYAVAKTGTGDIVDSVTSNIGHCLWMETIPAERVDPVAARLTDDALAGGWGLRTLSAAEKGYSPVSYHAGGVWPHDTSLTALGLSAHGYGDAADELARHVLDAATSFSHQRLPELYCGFDRTAQPTTYPAACTPQAWAAGAPFAFLRASLGLRPDGTGGVEATRSSSLFPHTAVPDGSVDGVGQRDECSQTDPSSTEQ